MVDRLNGPTADKRTSKGLGDLPDYTPPSSTSSGSILVTVTPGGRRSLCEKALEDGNGRKWLSLFVESRSPTSNSLPLVYEGDEIKGRIKLNARKPEALKGITITLTAGTTFVGWEEEKFLSIEVPIWSPSTPDEKLLGEHSWPFTILPPEEVNIVADRDGTRGTFTLPPSFTEKGGVAYLDYKLIVTIGRRGFMRANKTLSTNVVYLPVTFPEPPSPLRTRAYAERSPIPAPDLDPMGWRKFPPLKVRGTLFNSRKVEVYVQLSIGAPLTYALGSPIPLHLLLIGDDHEALDLLSNPKGVRIHLTRMVATGSEAMVLSTATRSDKSFLQRTGSAYLWPGKEPVIDNERTLEGELEVGRTLKPSFLFPRLSVQYFIQLCAFNGAGFVQDLVEGGDILLSEPVVISSHQLPGINPHSYAPPGYERPRSENYVNSVGLLENGNQRFIGHHTLS